MSRLCCIVLGCLSVSSALAECLDGDSLEQGILVRFTDGTQLTISRQDGDLLELSQEDDTVGREIVHAWHGVFVTSAEFVAEDGNHLQSNMAFWAPPPRPAAGAAATLPISELGALTTLSCRVDEVPPLVIDACRYEMTVVFQDRVVVRGRTPYVGSLYLPSLGFGFAGEADAIAALERLK